MPPPIPVELCPHDPAWAETARTEAARLAAVLGDNLLIVHHVGSTAIPGIRAKPIVDLMPVVADLHRLDEARPGSRPSATVGGVSTGCRVGAIAPSTTRRPGSEGFNCTAFKPAQALAFSRPPA